MKRIILRAPGKINWTLEVIGKRDDGYHEVRMLMQSVNLFDEITLTDCSDGIIIVSDFKGMPLDENNIAYRAADMLKIYSNRTSGIEIGIKKRIPMAAGMAGGSTDAAAVLVGLNELWSLGLSYDELETIGKDIGADVPFCIQGGTALAEGIGEKLTHQEPINDIWLVVVKPPFDVATADIYKGVDMKNLVKNIDVEIVYKQLKNTDYLVNGLTGLGNDLERVCLALYPEIEKIKELLEKCGACASMMTGSGPSVYGVFDEQIKAKKAKEYINKYYAQVYLVKTWKKGPEIISIGDGGI